MDSASPPQLLLGLTLAALPAIAASLFAAASTAASGLSSARRAALRDTLQGGPRAALERYAAAGPAIESRWLVLRVLGIATGVLLLGRTLPDALGAWKTVLAALGALVGYGVPTEMLRALVLRSPERWAPLLLQVLRPFELLAAPIAAPILWVGRLVTPSVTPGPPPARVTETEVEIIVNEGEQEGSLGHDQSEMIRNVLDFADATAGDVMVPRTHVTAFDIEIPIDDLLHRVAETKHSRYPVYRNGIDNVIGLLHVKDLVAYAADHDLREIRLEDILRKPIAFVPETRKASGVLSEMRAGRHHLAMVIDEFGGVSGIVTLEDLVEEIVGDIRNETETEEPPIVDLGDGRLVVDASMSIADLSRYLGTALPPNGGYNSLGGSIVAELGRVPRSGDTLSAFGLDFVVREADERHVAKVEIVRAPPGPESLAPALDRHLGGMTDDVPEPVAEHPVVRTIEPEVGDGWPVHGLGPVSEIVKLLPDPTELPPGARVAVGTGATEQRGLLSRLFSSSTPKPRVHLAVRCTALLVRGYTSISADPAGIAYGIAVSR